MAKLITRTFDGTNVVALVYNKKSNESEEHEVYISGKYDDSEKLEKAVAKMFKNPDYKFITVLSAVDASELRGMTEEDFIKYSVILDKESRKIAK